MTEASLKKMKKSFSIDFEELINNCYQDFDTLTDQIDFLERSKEEARREIIRYPDLKEEYETLRTLIDAELKFWDEVQSYKLRLGRNIIIKPIWPNVKYGHLIERLCILEDLSYKAIIKSIQLFVGKEIGLERIYLNLCLKHMETLSRSLEDSKFIRRICSELKFHIDDLQISKSESITGDKLRKFLKQFEDLKWTEIEWTFIPEQEVLLKIREMQEVFSYLHLGLEDNRKAGKPRLITTLLKEGFAKQYGKLSWTERTSLKINERNKKTISELRKHLKGIFMIEEDPIVYDRGERAYKIKIQVFDESEEDSFDYSGEYSP